MSVLPNTGDEPFTDYSRWRLVVDDVGNHTWDYVSEDRGSLAPQSEIEKYWLGLALNTPSLENATTPLQTAQNGFSFFKRLQHAGGHWPGEYGGPMFMLPFLVIGSFIVGAEIKREEKLEMIRYLFNRANEEDGGWGLHIEGPSTVLGTVLNYVALRLLGVEKDHPITAKARQKLHDLGGACKSPSWGKFWLALLNVYPYSGLNPIPPELWIFPQSLPIHPSKWWIHCRMVYLPMSYLYGVRYAIDENPLIISLRSELYTESYSSIDFSSKANDIALVDLYSPHTILYDTLTLFGNMYESVAPSFTTLSGLRSKALDKILSLIKAEDVNTSYQDIAPVSKMLNLISRYHAEGANFEDWIQSETYEKHSRTMRDFMWLGPDGMRVCGTNGSQCWDLAFLIQAILSTPLAADPSNRDTLERALGWLDRNQTRESVRGKEGVGNEWREETKGAWGFSTITQGYTLSDCTGEALKVVVRLQREFGFKEVVEEARLRDAVDVLLGMQNTDGGLGSYEKIRGPSFLEWINPAEVFGNNMAERSFVECTTSAITGLLEFNKHFTYRSEDIISAAKRATKYILSQQLPNGAWYGSWGICYTYGTLFALHFLSSIGLTYETSEAVRNGCEFLCSVQNDDGGWGESWTSCSTETYVPIRSQVVHTSWAVLALIYAEYPNPLPLKRGVRLVMSRQQPNGSWEQEDIEGIFNKTCAISYPN
ncbi:terpene synthase [Sistotremastrum niveocremeum HHB9708]|uniref:Terpene cyclase/mutase family member n=2 Tax=Sistotremastraceae TaxID=3402574 RepID=A0A164P9A3_9AGAM|nr:terpene synthase [Sistotremastrum niveocremeum HHB9708]KZT33484.1 lanosterol synthase [Sistotremastrum suecicum HHB10207 ss-3]